MGPWEGTQGAGPEGALQGREAGRGNEWAGGSSSPHCYGPLLAQMPSREVFLTPSEKLQGTSVLLSVPEDSVCRCVMEMWAHLWAPPGCGDTAGHQLAEGAGM